MKTKRLVLLPLLATSMLAGCNGGASSNEIQLLIWEDESNVEVVKELAEEWVGQYKKAYPATPKISIKVNKQPEKSAVEQMQLHAKTGHGPDIAAVTHDSIAKGVADNILAPATFVDEIGRTSTEAAVNAVSYNDTVYGYPITAESMVIMYNKEKVDNPSKLASFQSIKENGIKLGLAMTGDDGGYYTWGLYTDAELFGEDGKDPTSVRLAQEHSIANVQKFYSEYKDSFVDNKPEINLSLVKRAQNGIDGIISAPYMYADMKNALGDQLGVAVLPTINDEAERPFSGYKAYCVSAYSPNAALAHLLAKHLTSLDAQAYRLAQKGYLPAAELDASEDIAQLIENSAEAKVFAESLEHSRVMPNIPNISKFWQYMNQASTYFLEKGSALTTAEVTAKLQETEGLIIK